MDIHSGVVKKPLLLSDLGQFESIDKIIIDSLEQALYRVEVIVGADVYYLLEKPSKNLTRRSVVEIQKLFMAYTVKEMFLRHSSPYDEMIGMSEGEQRNNELLVPVGNYFAQEAPKIVH
jgi:hypothetical protein